MSVPGGPVAKHGRPGKTRCGNPRFPRLGGRLENHIPCGVFFRALDDWLMVLK